MKVELNWKEGLAFDVKAGLNAVAMDAKAPLGRGKAPTPKELVAAGLTGCTAMVIMAFMRKHRQEVTRFSINADITTSDKDVHPAVFTSAKLKFHLEGTVDPAKAVEAAQLSQTQECSVHAMLVRLTKCLAVSLLASLSANAQALIVCVENEPFLPLCNGNLLQPGNAQILLAIAAQNMKVPLQIQFVPWKRCLALVSTGAYDAMLCAAYAGRNPQIAVFPMLHPETPDASKSVGSLKTYLYRRKGSKVDYVNGKFIGPVKLVVGISSGYQSHMDAVTKGGALYNDSARSLEQLGKMLFAGRVDFVASEYAFDSLVKERYQDKLEKLPAPLLEVNYYLAFSKHYCNRNREIAEKLWNEIAKVRISPTYNKIIQK